MNLWTTCLGEWEKGDIMVVKFSKEAQFSIQEYRDSLSEPPYSCNDDRIHELCKKMIDSIVKKASNADSLQVCPYKILGQEKDKDDKPINQNLRWFQYESPSSSVWGVSVMCDFEHDVATVHRIVHSSFIKESSMRWIPLQDFNKQINKVNTMKWKRIYNESTDVKFVILKTSHSFSGCVKFVFDSLEQAAAFVVYQITNEDDRYDKRVRRKMYKTLLDYRHFQDEDNEYNIWEVKPSKDDYVQYI